jgi:hypothetical protein
LVNQTDFSDRNVLKILEVTNDAKSYFSIALEAFQEREDQEAIISVLLDRMEKEGIDIYRSLLNSIYSSCTSEQQFRVRRAHAEETPELYAGPNYDYIGP